MKRLQGTLTLPGSKSESNRALMIAAYGGFPLDADNLSDAHDTILLKSLLERIHAGKSTDAVVLDCEDAGTVFRFLTTYLAGKPGTWVLTGTPRLFERPMAPLIGALRQLGADIAPGSSLRIVGKPMVGGCVTLDASLSSQFASSLLMAAPTWERGLQLTLTGSLVSMPYLEMTLSMMRRFGIDVVRKGNTISVAHQPYHSCHFTVSADWSAASYWYEMLALSAGGSLLLKGLKCETLQGDAQVADFFKPLGIVTEYTNDGVLITSSGPLQSVEEPLEFDFLDTPDLFPSVFVSCIVLHVESVFYHITTLYNKESDRVNSLVAELLKYYTFINIIDNNNLIIFQSSFKNSTINKKGISFTTYDDHRIAMALAGLKVRFDGVVFDRPDVVNKSYPAFWDDVQRVMDA